MKILHFIPGFNFGGIETTFINIVSNNNRNDIEFCLMVEDNFYEVAKKSLDGFNVRIYSIPKLKKNGLLSYCKKIDQIMKVNNFDIVQSFNIKRTPLFFLLAKLNGINTRIFNARMSKTTSQKIQEYIDRVFIYVSIKLSSHLTANSKESGRYFFKNRKFTILKNGLNLDKMKFSKSVRNYNRSKLNLNKSFVIGHIGRFTELKNHEYLLELFIRLLAKDPSCKLLIVGDGPQKSKILRFVEQRNLIDKVIMIDRQEDISIFLNCMDVFVFPSKHEGFGNIILEAEACGLKVITSTGVPKSVNVNKQTIFLPLDKNYENWVSEILTSRRPDEERKKFSFKNKNNEYSIERTLIELIDYYQKVVEE